MAFENPSGRFYNPESLGNLRSAVGSTASVGTALPAGLQMQGEGIGSPWLACALLKQEGGSA